MLRMIGIFSSDAFADGEFTQNIVIVTLTFLFSFLSVNTRAENLASASDYSEPSHRRIAWK